MLSFITFGIGLIGGFLLGKKHGAKAQALADNLQARLDAISDKYK